jgi:hypothetical protein
MVASKCSRNHFISDKYKTVHLIMLHFHQSSPFMQICTFSSDYTVVGSISGSHFSKPFQLFHRIHNFVSSVTKAPSLQCWFQSREQVKISWRQLRCSSVDTFLFAEKSLTTIYRCAGEFSWRRNQFFVLHLSWCFILSIPKTRKENYVHLIVVRTLLYS